jgi:hypothetical protein
MWTNTKGINPPCRVAYLRSGADGVATGGTGVSGGATGDTVGSTLVGSVVDPTGILVPTIFEDSFI